MAHSPRKQPRQGRAEVTQATIVEAAARILEQAGQAGLTTNHIAERAGVSIGSLYQYYPNKEAVIAALLRREWSELLVRIEEVSGRTAKLSASKAVSAMIDVAIEHQFARPKMALELEFIEGSMDLDAEMTALSYTLARAVLGILQRFDPTADAATAQDVVAICNGMVNAAAIAGETDANSISRRLHKAVFGYLG